MEYGKKDLDFNVHCRKSNDLLMRYCLAKNQINPVGTMLVFCKSFQVKWKWDKLEEEKDLQIKLKVLQERLDDLKKEEFLARQYEAMKRTEKSTRKAISTTRSQYSSVVKAGKVAITDAITTDRFTKMYKTCNDYI